MSAKEVFFRNNAFQPFTGNMDADDVLHWFNTHNASLLSAEEANHMRHDEFFDLVTTYHPSWNQIDALPRMAAGIKHTLIPFSFDEHDEQKIEKETLSSFFEKQINRKMCGLKYLLSCDPRHFVALSMTNFSYEILYGAIQNGGTNTHFVLFNDQRNLWITFCSEFPFVVVSYNDVDEDNSILGRSHDFWLKYFFECTPQAIRLAEPIFIEFLNATYIPRLKEYSSFPMP